VYISVNFLSNQAEYITNTLNEIEASNRWRYLLKSLSSDLQIELFNRLIWGRITNLLPEPRDWIDLFQLTKYSAMRSFELWISLFFTLFISVIAGVQAYESGTSFGKETNLAHLAIIILILSNVFLWKFIPSNNQISDTSSIQQQVTCTYTCFSPVGSLTVWWMIFDEARKFFLEQKEKANWLENLIYLLWSIPLLFFTPSIVYLVTVSVFGVWQWNYGLSIWLIFTAIYIILSTIAWRKERKARNPLQGILDPPTAGTTSTRKWYKSLFRLFIFR